MEAVSIAPALETEAAACLALLPEVVGLPVELLIAKRAHAIVGAAAVHWRNLGEPVGFPLSIHVLPPDRRLGIGRRLLDAAIGLAIEDTDRFWSLKPWATDDPAAAFLVSCGFEPGRWEHHFEAATDAVLADVAPHAARLRARGWIPDDLRIVPLAEAPLREVGRLLAKALGATPAQARDLHAWADDIETKYGYPLTRIPAADLPRWIASPRYHGAVHDPRSGHLHPLKYVLGLARAAAEAGVRIFEHSEVTALQRDGGLTLKTGAGEVKAAQVLLAGNVYLQDVAPALEPRIMPVGTYIVCSEPLDEALASSLVPTRSAVCDTDFVLDYYRTTNDHRMLFGGRVSYSTRTPANLQQSMHRRMVDAFPQLASAKIQYAWGGFVDITMNRAPDFGRLGNDVYYLQGFSGHGLALTGLAGRVVAEAMTADAGRFDLFARLKHRAFPGGRALRTPALVLGMAWYRLKDLL